MYRYIFVYKSIKKIIHLYTCKYMYYMHIYTYMHKYCS